VWENLRVLLNSGGKERGHGVVRHLGLEQGRNDACRRLDPRDSEKSPQHPSASERLARKLSIHMPTDAPPML
jgi:hypothetical protein